MIESTAMTREFRLGELTLPDPSPAMPPKEVAALYAATYPELTNAAVEGPEVKGSRQVFTFSTSYGSKG